MTPGKELRVWVRDTYRCLLRDLSSEHVAGRLTECEQKPAAEAALAYQVADAVLFLDLRRLGAFTSTRRTCSRSVSVDAGLGVFRPIKIILMPSTEDSFFSPDILDSSACTRASRALTSSFRSSAFVSMGAAQCQLRQDARER